MEESDPFAPAGGERIRLLVGFVEGRVETSEEKGHGDVRLPMPVVHRGIEEGGFPIRETEAVPTPKVAVQERGSLLGDERMQAGAYRFRMAEVFR